ncbi:hypothetical protein GGD81_004033 [Rhodobium orientis]|nr:hypothetical protein [Rhodobium orientis]
MRLETDFEKKHPTINLMLVFLFLTLTYSNGSDYIFVSACFIFILYVIRYIYLIFVVRKEEK